MMNKMALRKKYKELRETLTTEDIDNLSLMIANQALLLPIWDKANYHLFLSLTNKKEVNTEYILHILSGKDKNIILSNSNFENASMKHYLLTDNTRLKVNSYGIPEPIDGLEVPEHQIDLVFVPLLAYDKKGSRIGYGKGFYDRFLDLCKPETIKVGLSFFDPEEEIEEVLETDVPIDYCITPKSIYRF